MRAALDTDELEPGLMPLPALHDLGFLDSMDQLEEGLRPDYPDPDAAFWRVPSDPTKAFVAVTDLTIERSGRRLTAIQPGILAVGFFLLILAGAAASAFVFADRVGRLWV